MFARFVRFISWPDKAYKNKPVPEKQKTDWSGKPKLKKNYCRSCDWLISATSGYSCSHKSNKVFEQGKNSWLTPELNFSLREHPKQKNRNNQCPHYSEKIG